jgi:hypothetical protein
LLELCPQIVPLGPQAELSEYENKILGKWEMHHHHHFAMMKALIPNSLSTKAAYNRTKKIFTTSKGSSWALGGFTNKNVTEEEI